MLLSAEKETRPRCGASSWNSLQESWGPLVGLGPLVPHSEMPVGTLLEVAEACSTSSGASEALGAMGGKGPSWSDAVRGPRKAH